MKQWKWLVLAVVLFGAAAWLMRTGEKLDTGPKKRGSDVRIPRRQTSAEVDRAVRRRTLPARPPVASTDSAPPEVRDPVLRALAPRKKGDNAAVIEVNAIRHSPVAEMLIRCMDDDVRKQLDDMKEKLGIDPLQDVDRLVLGPNKTAIMSGDLKKLNAGMFEEFETSMPYGDKGTIHHGGKDRWVATEWQDEMVIFSESIEEAQASIDRLEGRTAVSEPALVESDTYGEAYGHITPELLARMLPQRDGLEEELIAAASDIELHLDTRSDVGVVVDVHGDDPAAMEDLKVMIGAALSVARIQARAEGDEELSDLLDMAKVLPEGESFRLEMAVPLDFLKKNLGECAEQPATPAAIEKTHRETGRSDK